MFENAPPKLTSGGGWVERPASLPDWRVNLVDYSQSYRSSDVSLLVDH